MFTAPHGLQVYRIGEGGRPRVHQRERHSTEIALRLALAVGSMIHFKPSSTDGDTTSATTTARSIGTAGGKSTGKSSPQPSGKVCSFCVWNCLTAKPLDEENLDPNYLFSKMFNSSPWQSSLRAFKHHVEHNLGIPLASSGGVGNVPPSVCEREHLIGSWWSSATEGGAPLPAGTVPLHIDIHGKINRQGNFDLDVGLASMDYFFPPERILLLRDALERELSVAIRACPVELKGMPATVNMNPYLSGLWGVYDGAPHTMTTQAVLQGVHSLQLEVPHLMRTALMSTVNCGFFVAFATAIAKVFVAIQHPSVQSQIYLTEIPQSVLEMKTGTARAGGASAGGSPLLPPTPAQSQSSFVSPCPQPPLDVAASATVLLRETIMFYQSSDKKQI